MLLFSLGNADKTSQQVNGKETYSFHGDSAKIKSVNTR